MFCRYRENALRVSRVYKDRPVAPADSAVFWLEYVIRHNGAHHLRSVAASMPWYQLSLLDVVAGLAAAAVVAVLLVCWLVRRLIRAVFSRRIIKASEKSKKNR